MLSVPLIDPHWLMGVPPSIKRGVKPAAPGAGLLAFTGQQVGPGCPNDYYDVKTVQQLLAAAGYGAVGAADGYWGKKNADTNSNTAKALRAFMNAHGSPEQRRTLVLMPNDDLLLIMARQAKLVIPLTGKTGMAGVTETHKWLNANGIKYNSGAEKVPPEGNRALWGVSGHRDAVIQTRSGGFANARPVELDCTIYVNLMLSIYLYGDVHTKYQAACNKWGATSEEHLCREFYGLPLILRGTHNSFSSAAEITEVTSAAPSKVYVIEVGGEARGGVSHMALLHESRVYECTTHQPRSACIDSTLQDFIAHTFRQRKKPLYLFGPR